MKNKTLMVTIILLMALASSLPFWLDAISTSENYDSLYNAVFYGLTAIAFICSAGFLITEVKKINDKVWLLLLIIIPISSVFFGNIFGGAFVRMENRVAGILSEPIIWFLIATLIGHLILFFYRRNKQQMN